MDIFEKLFFEIELWQRMKSFQTVKNVDFMVLRDFNGDMLFLTKGLLKWGFYS